MPKSQAIQLGVLILALSLVLGLISGCQSAVRDVSPPDNGNPMVGQVLAVFDEDGDPYDLLLFKNGNAVSTTTKSRTGGAYGVVGRWSATPETIFISYDDGSKEAFVYYDDTIRRQEYFPRRSVTTTANRYQYGWMVKTSRARYTGIWYCTSPVDVQKKSKSPAKYVARLNSDGTATRTDNKDVTGKWDVSNDHTATVTWSDGTKDMIVESGEGYEMRTWPAGGKSDQGGGIKTRPVRRGAF